LFGNGETPLQQVAEVKSNEPLGIGSSGAESFHCPPFSSKVMKLASRHDASAELIQTIRLLSRSHRRFTEEQKVKVFRSLIKETRMTESGVEFEMYIEPTQNVWWKYRSGIMLRETESKYQESNTHQSCLLIRDSCAGQN